MVEASKHLIAIDDGHGPQTAGKRTPYISALGRQIRENEFNKAVVDYLDAELKEQGFRTIQTAPTDADTPLSTRTNTANQAGADLLISLHFNAMGSTFGYSSAKGFSVHIQPADKANPNSGSLKFAKLAVEELAAGTAQVNRGVVGQNLHMTRETKMPAALVECGFMDDPEEALLMIDPVFQKEVASELARAVCRYFGVSYQEDVKQVSNPVASKPFVSAPKPSASKVESIVDYLNARNMDASFSARAKLATQYGISGYKGEAEQNTLLLERIRSGWKPAVKAKPSTAKTNSVVDYLNRQGKDSSFGARAKLAEQYGIRNYSGDADENLQLLEKLQGGAPKQTKEYVHLPKSATAWKTYKLNVQPVSKNSDWSLTPSRFGGLDYEVLGKPFANVVTIQTSRGKRNIYVAPSTGAKIYRK